MLEENDGSNKADPTPVCAMAISNNGDKYAIWGPGHSLYIVDSPTNKTIKKSCNIWPLMGQPEGTKNNKRFHVLAMLDDIGVVVWGKAGWDLNDGTMLFDGEKRADRSGEALNPKKWKHVLDDPRSKLFSGSWLDTRLTGYLSTPDEWVLNNELRKDVAAKVRARFVKQQPYIDAAVAASQNGCSFHHEFADPGLRQFDSTTLVFRQQKDDKELLRLLFHENGDWIALTPDGFYDTPNEGSINWAWWNDEELDIQLPLSALTKARRLRGLVGMVLNDAALPEGGPTLAEAFRAASGCAAMYE